MPRLLVLTMILIQSQPGFGANSSVELRLQQEGATADASSLQIVAGQTIALSADLWGSGGDCTLPTGCAQNRPAEDFLWSSDDRPNAVCDPFNASECSAETDFRVTPAGVQFVAPSSVNQPVSITARQRAGDLMARVTAIVSAPVVEEVLATPPADIIVLRQMGHWVVIDGTSFWVPTSYRPGWVPYQHGHWAFVAGEGWTWVSYDPWGAYTDHYGVWRLHATYGWIWLPFERPIYHPCTVTFFFSGGHIGWSPYYSAWPGAYRWGEAAGFRDGFHAGMAAAATPHGATVVGARDFYADNIYRAKLNDERVAPIYRQAVASRAIAPQPGGLTPQSSRTWMAKQAKPETFPQTSTGEVRGPEAHFRTPVPVHPLPKEYPQSKFTSLPKPMRLVRRADHRKD